MLYYVDLPFPYFSLLLLLHILAISEHFALAEVEGDPSAIIAGCVNAITGNYCDTQVDLVLNGPEPLLLQRFYCSADWKGGSLGDGWNHTHDPFGGIYADIIKKFYWARLPQPSGGSMLFTSSKGVVSYSEYGIYHPSILQLGIGKKKIS